MRDSIQTYVVVISQYIHISNNYAVHLKLTQHFIFQQKSEGPRVESSQKSDIELLERGPGTDLRAMVLKREVGPLPGKSNVSQRYILS